MRLLLVFLFLVHSAFAQWYPHYVSGRAGIVHLFEWHWGTVADECETFLGPNKFAGVQVCLAIFCIFILNILCCTFRYLFIFSTIWRFSHG